MCPYSDEIKRRIEKRDGKPIQFTQRYGIETYSLIPAWQSRNTDGSPAGYIAGTEDGDRIILQRTCTDPNNAELSYTNWW